MRIYLVQILILFFFVSCNSHKLSQKTDKEITYDKILKPNSNQIILLNLEINNKDSINLINSFINKGKLKKDIKNNLKKNPGDLICSFLNKNKEIVSSIIVSNPLQKKWNIQITIKIYKLKL